MAAAVKRINQPGTFATVGLNLPIELRNWLRRRALDEETTSSELVARVLEDYRKKIERKGKKS